MSDFLSFIVVEHIRFFHGALQLTLNVVTVSISIAFVNRILNVLVTV